MLKSELDELIEKSFEQAKETCVCEKCYKEKATPLIFPILEQQKAILISEAPYNFPPPEIVERRKFHWTKYFKQDLECFIYCELGPYLTSPRSQGIPENIFDFISLIFHPLIKECKTKEHGIKTFLNNVYWTHMAKKSLKGISKNGAISKCLEKFPQEFNCIYEKCGNNIKLFIICTSYFYNKFTKYPKWELITNQQFVILETEDRLLKIDDILVPSKSTAKLTPP